MVRRKGGNDLIRRINELARKQRSPLGLSEAEQAEQHALRQAYLQAVRASLREQLAGQKAGKLQSICSCGTCGGTNKHHNR
ncbi:MAG: DUF896 domain-containing protein [Firmicutes bacterium]|nr:DUF896 domain-containing protein [Bacillota bacterium]